MMGDTIDSIWHKNLRQTDFQLNLHFYLAKTNYQYGGPMPSNILSMVRVKPWPRKTANENKKRKK